METHNELNDLLFEREFAECSLDPRLFSHEAHLRLAWIHIRRYDIDKAISNITTQLKNFVAFHGAQGKYNETVTIAAIRAVYHFMLTSPEDNFKSFITQNQRLKNNFRELLSQHYKTDIFNSENVKNIYLEPELLPFD